MIVSCKRPIRGSRELKQPRRRRQQKPHKFAYLTMKNSIFARFARAFFIFTYGVHVWGLTFPTFLTQLFIVQKRAIRIIFFSEPKSHSEPLFKSLNLLKLNDVIESQILSFVYQWSHGLLPPCFSKYFNFTSSVHSYATRQSCNRNLYVASVNTTQYGLRSLKFTGPRPWNSLPTSITNSNSLRIFRKTLKDSMLNCYSN